MFRSLLKRFANALFLLGIISVIAFCLSKWVPGDEILDYLSIDESRYSSSSGPLEQRAAYRRVAEKRGLNLPLFYFSIHPGYFPDTLHRIIPVEDRHALEEWIRKSKNKTASVQLYRDLMYGLGMTCPSADTLELADEICQGINAVLNTKDFFSAHHQLLTLQQAVTKSANTDPLYVDMADQLNKDLENLIKAPHHLSMKEWLPSIHWYGTLNQYHQWMSGLITFTPLASLIDGRNAWSKILEALKWTLLLNGIAFLLSIILGMMTGIWSGTHDGSLAERLLNIKLFALFALPSFWLATLFIYFFASGEWLSLFPSGGLGQYNSAGTAFAKCGELISHLFLPVLCLTLGSLAYVSRQMKESVLHQLQMPYVFALRAQGVSEKTILRKHVFRNALFPMITMIGGSIPGLLSGSLIIEVIFSIPGMGRLLYTSLVARDWPVVFPVLMLAATITVFAIIITDIIYKWADPRVKTMES